MSRTKRYFNIQWYAF